MISWSELKWINHAETYRGLVNDTYKMDLILIHPPHLIALACIYTASVYREKDKTAWFEELRVDMNVVSSLSSILRLLLLFPPIIAIDSALKLSQLSALKDNWSIDLSWEPKG